MTASGSILAEAGGLRQSQRRSIDRRIFSAAASVAAASVLVKLAAAFKEFAVAGVFGRSDAMDAFLVAALIPGLLMNLISESMNQALAPTLIRVREREGHERAQELLSSSMLWMCLLLTAVSAAMALTARGLFPLIASHFPAAKLDLSDAAFLCVAAGGAHYRHRHQLHRGAEYLRPLCSCRRWLRW